MTTVLVARSTERLERLAEELNQAYHTRAVAITVDLSTPGAVADLISELDRRNLKVDLLINNAGFGLHGSFEALSADQQMSEIQVNVASLVALTRAIAPGMLARSSGAIINIASTLAFQPDPFMAVYGATKAFVLSFTLALAEEYRGRGVRVLALCPGVTATPFYQVAGGESVFARMRTRKPEQVVATGLRALERGRKVVIDGAANRWLFGLTAALPATMSAKMVGGALRPKRD